MFSFSLNCFKFSHETYLPIWNVEVCCCFLNIRRFSSYFSVIWGFPDSSVGKEYACNAGDPSSIPRSGRSTGKGIGYPLQYSWASLVSQLVKNLPAMWETCVQSLGWEDTLEKGKSTHFSILAWRIPWTVQSIGPQRVRHNWANFTFIFHYTDISLWLPIYLSMDIWGGFHIFDYEEYSSYCQ